MIAQYLEKLEARIDLDWLEEVKAGYRRVFAWESCDELPYIYGKLPPVEDENWPAFEYNDAFVDREKMLLDQLRPVYLSAQARDYRAPAIRCNYGTVILPSIMGGDWQLTETSLPWAHHLTDRDAIRALIDRGVPDSRSGLGGVCFDTASYYLETLRPYEKLSSAVMVFHPDLQGPFDVAHLLWGPDIFMAMYDCPELVHTLMDLVVETYVGWLSEWKSLVGEGNDWTAHWRSLMRGGAMLRNDTPVMISSEQYREFVKPYDQRVLDVFGGCVHFCGSGKPFLDDMATSEHLYALNMSQPDWNDMDAFWALCQEHRVVVLEMDEAWVPEGMRTGVTVVRDYGLVASQ